MQHWTQTPEGKEHMRKAMKARWASGEFTGTRGKTWKAKAKAVKKERFDVGDKVIMISPEPVLAREERAGKVQRAYGRNLYSLAKYVRAEIHKHVRAGNELEPVHTHTLALTDAILHNGDGE